LTHGVARFALHPRQWPTRLSFGLFRPVKLGEMKTHPAHFLFPIILAALTALTAQGAPSDPQQASSKPHAKAHAASSAPGEGTLQDGIYRNSFFGFACKVPYGWVDRTSDMAGTAEPGESMLLLSVFERPPQATGEGVNSAIVIAAESASSYPGLKTAADYFGPLTEVTTSKGFKVVEEPYEFAAGSKAMVRSDFSKESGAATVYQASLAILEKGYAVSFTFLGSNKEDVDQLIEGLSFGASTAHSKAAK
jgi:hypothetical protein